MGTIATKIKQLLSCCFCPCSHFHSECCGENSVIEIDYDKQVQDTDTEIQIGCRSCLYHKKSIVPTAKII